MNKESMYSPYEELPLITGVDPKYQKYRRFAKASLFLSLLSVIFAASSLHRSHHPRAHQHHYKDGEVVDVSFIGTSFNETNAQIYTVDRCYGEWDLSKEEEFTLPQDYTGLIINSRYYHSVSGKKTDAVVVINPELESPKVTFDLHFSDLDDADDTDKLVHIDVREENSGTFHLTVVVGDASRSSPEGDTLCFNFDVTIELPTADALHRLSVGVPYSDITVKDVFTFEDSLKLGTIKGDVVFAKDGVQTDALDLSTGSGLIQFGAVTAATDVHLSTASGDIMANFHTLGGSMSVSSASGTVAVTADTITEGNQQVTMSASSGAVGLTVHAIESGHKKIKLSAVSGEVDATLPESFTSEFRLSTFRGHFTVEADHPDKIRYSRKGFNTIQGTYDNPITDEGQVSLSTVSGDITLKYSSQQ